MFYVFILDFFEFLRYNKCIRLIFARIKVKSMKILKIVASGLPLFADKCEIDFVAQQRVTEDNAEKMSCLFSAKGQSYYQNNVMAYIGINASGKTTLLKLITFVCELVNNVPVNNIKCREILDGIGENDKVVFDTYFYADNNSTYPFTKDGAINWLNTVIAKEKGKFVVKYETLKSKPLSKVNSKKTLFDFTNCEINLSRNINSEYLLDDLSIMVAFNKKNKEELIITDMLQYTNINQLSISKDCPPELIAFFDPSVEYLKVKKKGQDTDISLKFKGKPELILNQFSDLNRYLSSGTIKGINTFLNAVKIFETGGYLIVDELENHFNREIVSTLIRFFMDKKVNSKGAMLIFSTHYSELLDEFERNDNTYIVRNKNGIKAENLAGLLKRNDIKKSEAYQSGFLEGTAPMYDAYINLKKSLIANCNEGTDGTY